MVRYFAFVLTLCSLLAIFWFSGRIGQRVHCINSSIVKSFYLDNASGSISIPNCRDGYLQDLPGRIRDRVGELNRFFVKFEQFFELPDNASVPTLGIRVLLSKPLEWNQQGGVLLVGEDVFFERGILEKGILQSILFRKKFASRPFIADVSVDAVYSALTGDLSVSDPVFGREGLDYSSENLFWLEHSRSLEQVCRSPWRPFSMLSTCELVEDIGIRGSPSQKETLKNISLVGYRSFMLQVFWNVFRKVPIADRMEFLSTWLKNLYSEPWVKNDTILFSDFKLAKSYLKNLLDKLYGGRKLQSFVNKNKLLSRIEVSDASVSQFDMLIRLNGGVHRVQKWANRYNGFFGPKSLRVVVLHGEKIFFLPNKKPVLADSLLEVVQTQRIVWEDCGKVRVKNVLRQAPSKGKAMVVENCDGDKELDYWAFLVDGVQGYAKANLGSKFWLMDLASLRFGLKWGLRQKHVFEFKQKRGPISKVEKMLGFDKPKFDDSLQAFRVSGVLPIVEWYRSGNDERPYLGQR